MRHQQEVLIQLLDPGCLQQFDLAVVWEVVPLLKLGAPTLDRRGLGLLPSCFDCCWFLIDGSSSFSGFNFSIVTHPRLPTNSRAIIVITSFWSVCCSNSRINLAVDVIEIGSHELVEGLVSRSLSLSLLLELVGSLEDLVDNIKSSIDT